MADSTLRVTWLNKEALKKSLAFDSPEQPQPIKSTKGMAPSVAS